MSTKLRDLILSVGTHKGVRPLSPLEVTESLVEHINDVGWDQALVDVSLDKTTAQRFLRLRHLRTEVAELVDWGRKPGAISFSVAAEVSRVSPDDQDALAESAVRHLMSKEEVRQVVQLMRRRNDTVAEAIRATLQMRPSTINIHVSIGAIYDPLAIDCLNRLSQSERDKFLADNIRDSALAVSGGKLASRSFSLVSEHPLADKEVSDFEARINSLAGKLSEAV